MPIDVPEATLTHLKSAPLKAAVVQVRYSPVHAVEKRDLVADFESRLDKRYVAQDPETSQGFTIQIGSGPSQAPFVPPPLVETVWPFKDDERGYAIALGHSSLAVEVDAAYHDFPHFLKEFSTAVRAFVAIFQPKREIRLGLRYINQVTNENLRQDIATVINPDLVSPVGRVVKGGLLRSFAELRVAESLGTFVIRHGLTEDPATYLLDFDYFSENERAFDARRVIKTVKGFHALIESFFVWSLTPDYLAELGQRNDNAA